MSVCITESNSTHTSSRQKVPSRQQRRRGDCQGPNVFSSTPEPAEGIVLLAATCALARPDLVPTPRGSTAKSIPSIALFDTPSYLELRLLLPLLITSAHSGSSSSSSRGDNTSLLSDLQKATTASLARQFGLLTVVRGIGARGRRMQQRRMFGLDLIDLRRCRTQPQPPIPRGSSGCEHASARAAAPRGPLHVGSY